MNVLITGAAGFLGTHVARTFRTEGATVVGIGHGNPNPSQLSHLSAWHGVDVTAENLLRCDGKPDVVVHCASGSLVSASTIDPSRDFTRSVACTNEVLNYMRVACPKAALVFASSAAVYGLGHNGVIDEETPTHPISPYGLHKALCEEMLAFYGRVYGIRSVSVRLFSIYGAGLKKQLPWDACRKFKAREATFSGTGGEVRDWLHVDDAARLMVMAARHVSTDAPICNGATELGVSVRAVVEELGLALGAQQQPAFDGTARAGDPPSLVGGNQIARSWGWSPKTEWRDGMRQYARWFLTEPPEESR